MHRRKTDLLLQTSWSFTNLCDKGTRKCCCLCTTFLPIPSALYLQRIMHDYEIIALTVSAMNELI